MSRRQTRSRSRQTSGAPWQTRFTCLLLALAGLGADWPQWLGPHRDGSSSEVVAPWKEAPAVIWRRPVGEGHSSPIVADGRVFLHTKVAERDEEEVTAFDAKTGKLLWQQSYARGPFASIFGNGPRSTPAVQGDRLFTVGVTGILSCFHAATGELAWRKDLIKEFKPPPLMFGVSCSPLILDEALYFNVGAPDASIVAFRTGDGSVLWHNLDDRASYSSPIVCGQGPQRQLIFLTQQGLVSLDPRRGRVNWRYPLLDLLNESSSTPAQAGDTLVASSITYGMVALRLGAKGKLLMAKEVWKDPNLTCYFSTPVAVGSKFLYVVTGTKPPSFNVQANLRSIDLRSGKELWQQPKVGRYHASLLRTGNDKLLMLEDRGDLVLLDPSPKQYQELARAKVCGETWALPALADGRLYVRDGKELICLRLGKR